MDSKIALDKSIKDIKYYVGASINNLISDTFRIKSSFVIEWNFKCIKT